MRRSVVLAVLSLVLVVPAFACGGRVDDGSSASSGSGSHDEASAGGGGGGGTSGDFSVCPDKPPRIDTACSSRGQGCRYVTVKGDCAAYACDGTWRSAPEGC